MNTTHSILIRASLWIGFLSGLISGQANRPEEGPIRIDTNTVFVDAIVQDKTTRKPVAGLGREDFELTVNGKPRAITTFSNDGYEKCPLTLVLHFNLAPNGALRFLVQPRARKSVEEALSKLGPNDTVAILTTDDWFAGSPRQLMEPTREWARVSSALAEAISSTEVAAYAMNRLPAEKAPMTEALDYVRKLGELDPRRHVVLAYISDGMNTLDLLRIKDRKTLAEGLQSYNVSVSSVSFKMKSGYAAAAKVVDPIGFVFGMSSTGGVIDLAERSGGISIKANGPEDLEAAILNIVELYASRYAIGFDLDVETEGNGRAMKIELKISKRTARKAPKRLTVAARRTLKIK